MILTDLMTTKMFSNMDPVLSTAMIHEPLTVNFHHYCTTPQVGNHYCTTPQVGNHYISVCASFRFYKILYLGCFDEKTISSVINIMYFLQNFTDFKMSENYTMMTTNLDDNGVEFVSTMEHKKYPIFGTQWHPEKNSFAWTDYYYIPHAENAIKLEQFVMNRFVHYGESKFI